MTMSATAFDVQRVREDFPILRERMPGDVPLIYLDSGASAQKPRQVIEQIRDCYETAYSNVHRGVHTLGDRVTVLLEESRETVRRYLSAESTDEIIFTSGTTAALNLVAQGWGRKFLQAGDEILVSVQEHHANFVPEEESSLNQTVQGRFSASTARAIDVRTATSLDSPTRYGWYRSIRTCRSCRLSPREVDSTPKSRGNRIFATSRASGIIDKVSPVEFNLSAQQPDRRLSLSLPSNICPEKTHASGDRSDTTEFPYRIDPSYSGFDKVASSR